MRRVVLGTAGHIDHGKTALVRALTGIDTDRLPEEKRRGITIDLGFARMELAGGIEAGIVDVPGHEAFIRNMLAGATGLDLMLLVVAADEGVMPQTREHLAIMELLGVRRGVVAVTKADLADAEWLELVCEDVRELLAATPLADLEIVPVSARAGTGLDALRAALAAAAAGSSERPADDVFRLPVDRVFTVKGTGTVVTGTVWSGSLRRDAHVRIEPSGLAARVRGLQHHGTATDEIRAGERAAIALAGVDRGALSRGDAVLAPGWEPSSLLTVELGVLRDAPAALRHRQRVRLHLGTAEVLGRLVLWDGDVAPGATALAQVRLEKPLVCRGGDRFVLRSYSPVRTVAGGAVLEPAPPRRKRLSAPARAALLDLRRAEAALPALLELAGSAGVPVAELPVVLGVARHDVAARADCAGAFVAGPRLVAPRYAAACRDAILREVAAFHREHPLEEGIEREALRRAASPSPDLFAAVAQELIACGTLRSAGSAVALSDFTPAAGAATAPVLEQLMAVLRDAGLEPPDVEELPPDLASRTDLPVLLRFLEGRGDAVRLTPSRWAAADAISSAVEVVRSHMGSEQGFGVGDFRDILGLSRKHLIPLLEYFDRAGVTVRTGDTRRVAERRDAAGDDRATPSPASPPARESPVREA
jgi:selenocysteine-specific elongation factor